MVGLRPRLLPPRATTSRPSRPSASAAAAARFRRAAAIAMRASKLGRMIAVCDVDVIHAAEFNAKFDNKLAMYGDYRQLLEREKPEIVTIGTPDHWHVPIAIAALQAGCDVYCEKPLTLTIEEGIRIREVVKETGKVFQVGTQQRSENDSRFLKAIAIVQSGRLGKKVNAHVAIGGGPVGGPFQNDSAARWPQLGHVARQCQRGRLFARTPQGVSLVLRLLRRQDDRLGRPPHRYRPMGARPRSLGPGENQRHRQVHADRARQVRLDRVPGRQGKAAQRLSHGQQVQHQPGIRRRLGAQRLRRIRVGRRQNQTSPTASCSKARMAASSSTAERSPASRSRR